MKKKSDKTLDEKSEIILRQLAEIALTQFLRDQKRNKQLEKTPGGYYMDDESEIYSCFICGRNFEAKDIWYDKYGYKCRDCQNNVLKKVISKTLSKKRSSWLEDWEITKLLNIHPATLRKLVRHNELKAIELTDFEGHIYHRLFFKKENPILDKTHKH